MEGGQRRRRDKKFRSTKMIKKKTEALGEMCLYSLVPSSGRSTYCYQVPS